MSLMRNSGSAIHTLCVVLCSFWISRKMNWSFSELIAAGAGDAKIARYISWIVGTYATPAVKDPQNQAEDFGMYARACGWKPKPKGYQRKTK